MKKYLGANSIYTLEFNSTKREHKLMKCEVCGKRFGIKNRMDYEAKNQGDKIYSMCLKDYARQIGLNSI